MEFHGVKDKTDMWINYSPWGCSCNMDQRVIDFFNDVYERGMSKYNDMVFEMQREDREKEEEEKDLKEFKRLKEKYKE